MAIVPKLIKAALNLSRALPEQVLSRSGLGARVNR